MAKFVELMDTTLRDGEQTMGVSFTPAEKLNIAKMLLLEAKLDRIEIGSALVSKGEIESVKEVCKWANEAGYLENIEVLGLVDGKRSIDWIRDCGGNAINLLAKGSLKHLTTQLKKSENQHFLDISKTVEYAKETGMVVNVYLEDWSNGMKNSQIYVFNLIRHLISLNIDRIMLPDTLGVLTPKEAEGFISNTMGSFHGVHFDFHGHNDYGMATANSLAALHGGARGIHVTVNGLGERAGNASLEEVVANINDHTDWNTKVNEAALSNLSKVVAAFSGKRVSYNKPIIGESVFTQTAGIHADGDAKGGLYQNKLLPERFGREREYALGKLSGRASLEQNLNALGIDLSSEQEELVLKRIVELGDRKETLTREDLPYIIEDVLKRPVEQKIKMLKCSVSSGKDMAPKASFVLAFDGKEIEEEAEGDGGYDAFMNALSKAANKMKIKLPHLVDYEVRIPPGGKTDAIVETKISWELDNKRFTTIGVDSDQIMAAVAATEKMLNTITRNGVSAKKAKPKSQKKPATPKEKNKKPAKKVPVKIKKKK
ncbi:MAG: alpha-isopropylmalate synthase regulatory domain-containing protein [Candidatus Diapherotrites archaeon]